MVLFRFFLGVGEGIGNIFFYLTFIVLGLPTIFHILAHTVPMEERGRAFGYLIALGSVGQFVAGTIAPHLYWSLPFLLFGGAGLLWVIAWIGFTRTIGNYDQPISPDYFVPANQVKIRLPRLCLFM